MVRILTNRFIFLAFTLLFIKGALLANDNSPNIKSSVYSLSVLDISENPTKLQYIERNNLALSYTPSSFGLNGLNYNNIYGSFSTGELFHFVNYGGTFSDKFNRSNLSYSIGTKVVSRLTTSLTFNYSFMNIERFQSYDKIDINLNGIVELDSNLRAGFVFTNLLNSRYESESNTVRQEANFGLLYEVEDDFIIQVGTQIYLESTTGIMLGIAHNFEDWLNVGVSYLTNPQMLEGNLIIDTNNGFELIYDLNYHNYLGATHKFGLAYGFD